MLKVALQSAVLATAFLSHALAGTFESIKDPSCINSAFVASLSFSKGEQYNDSNNGVIQNRWFMLARWQGANESNFINNSVAYNVGAFTGLQAPYQRGVNPEYYTGTAAVQLNCYYSGMLINTWTIPHRPIVGGGYNDMIGYWFSPPTRVRPFVKNGVPTDLVLQSNIAVTLYYSQANRTGSLSNLVGQVVFFAYLRDTSNPSYAPVAVIAATHMSNFSEGPTYHSSGSLGWDYSGSDTSTKIAEYPYWFSSTPANGSGVWFASAPISSGNDHRYVTKMYSEGDLNGDLQLVYDPSATLLFWRAHVTPANLTNIVNDINAYVCVPPSCPPRPTGGYSSNPSSWVLEYAGVLAEAVVKGNVYDESRTNWGGESLGSYTV